jgi:hypothetical protein
MNELRYRINAFIDKYNYTKILHPDLKRKIAMTTALVGALAFTTGGIIAIAGRNLFSLSSDARQASQIATLYAKGTDIAKNNQNLNNVATAVVYNYNFVYSELGKRDNELSTAVSQREKSNKDLLACQNTPKQDNNDIASLNTKLQNANATITSLNATNVALSARVYELTSTAQLTATDFISRMAEALRNGDQETINWLNTVGCVAPTETPSPISTTVVLPTSSATATATPTQSPTATPTIIFTPENTNPPADTNTPRPTNTKSAPTRIPPYTATPDNTPLPTFTSNPTMTPRPTDTTVPPTGTPDAGTKVPPTRIPVVTFTPRPEFN